MSPALKKPMPCGICGGTSQDRNGNLHVRFRCARCGKMVGFCCRRRHSREVRVSKPGEQPWRSKKYHACVKCEPLAPWPLPPLDLPKVIP